MTRRVRAEECELTIQTERANGKDSLSTVSGFSGACAATTTSVGSDTFTTARSGGSLTRTCASFSGLLDGRTNRTW